MILKIVLGGNCPVAHLLVADLMLNTNIRVKLTIRRYLGKHGTILNAVKPTTFSKVNVIKNH